MARKTFLGLVWTFKKNKNKNKNKTELYEILKCVYIRLTNELNIRINLI